METVQNIEWINYKCHLWLQNEINHSVCSGLHSLSYVCRACVRIQTRTFFWRCTPRAKKFVITFNYSFSNPSKNRRDKVCGNQLTIKVQYQRGVNTRAILDSIMQQPHVAEVTQGRNHTHRYWEHRSHIEIDYVWIRLNTRYFCCQPPNGSSLVFRTIVWHFFGQPIALVNTPKSEICSNCSVISLYKRNLL